MLKWAWATDTGNWEYYDTPMQTLLTDVNKTVNFTRGKFNYSISYSALNGWQQLNINTGKYRPVTLI